MYARPLEPWPGGVQSGPGVSTIELGFFRTTEIVLATMKGSMPTFDGENFTIENASIFLMPAHASPPCSGMTSRPRTLLPGRQTDGEGRKAAKNGIVLYTRS